MQFHRASAHFCVDFAVPQEPKCTPLRRRSFMSSDPLKAANNQRTKQFRDFILTPIDSGVSFPLGLFSPVPELVVKFSGIDSHRV
jgi:hypothetical protein